MTQIHRIQTPNLTSDEFDAVIFEVVEWLRTRGIHEDDIPEILIEAGLCEYARTMCSHHLLGVLVGWRAFLEEKIAETRREMS